MPAVKKVFAIVRGHIGVTFAYGSREFGKLLLHRDAAPRTIDVSLIVFLPCLQGAMPADRMRMESAFRAAPRIQSP